MKNLRGFTLVELMIASVLSLVLLATLIQIFVSNKNTLQITGDFDQMQENASFIIQNLTRDLSIAGYRSLPNIQNNQTYQTIDTIYTASLPYISGSTNIGPNNSDNLIIRFQGSGNGTGTADGTIKNCLNHSIDANVINTDTYTLNNNNQLTCNGTALIDNVESFKVLFGQDTSGTHNASRYVPANYPSLNWNSVVSVKIAILLRSTHQNDTLASSHDYRLLNTTYTSPNDRFIRRVYNTTVHLRNMDQSSI